MFSKLALIAVSGLLLSLASGCAAQASSEDASSSEDALEIKPTEFRFDGSFKLYDELTAPNPQCDIHTILDLAARGNVLTANLADTVDGLCRPMLDTAVRAYTLTFDHESCGSRIYKGIGMVNGVERAMQLTDHRTRVCRDVVPAQLIVEEGVVNGEERTLFSDDGPGFIVR